MESGRETDEVKDDNSSPVIGPASYPGQGELSSRLDLYVPEVLHDEGMHWDGSRVKLQDACFVYTKTRWASRTETASIDCLF